MFRGCAFLLSILYLVLVPERASAQSCPRLETAHAELERAFFDQERVWNGFARSQEFRGCDAQVADILAAFRTEHASQLTDDNRSAFASRNRFKLYVTEARYAARSGQYERAIELLEHALTEPPEAREGTIMSFLDVQLAFLRRDQTALETARVQLRRELSSPPYNEGLYQLAGDLLLNQAEGFVRCFDRTYLEADTNACNSMVRAR